MHNKLMIIHAVAVLLSVRLAAFRIVDRRSTDQSSDPLKSILLGPDQSTANHRNASELAPVLHHIQQRLPLASRHQMQGRVASEGG